MVAAESGDDVGVLTEAASGVRGEEASEPFGAGHLDRSWLGPSAGVSGEDAAEDNAPAVNKKTSLASLRATVRVCAIYVVNHWAHGYSHVLSTHQTVHTHS